MLIAGKKRKENLPHSKMIKEFSCVCVSLVLFSRNSFMEVVEAAVCFYSYGSLMWAHFFSCLFTHERSHEHVSSRGGEEKEREKQVPR